MEILIYEFVYCYLEELLWNAFYCVKAKTNLWYCYAI